jgi:proteasome component ECM29
MWRELWHQNIGGEQMAIRLYRQELVELISLNIKSQSWPVKTQAALTVSAMTRALQSQDLSETVDSLLPLLTEALSGRTWAGKEAVLEAFGQLCRGCRAYFKINPVQLEAAYQLLLRESRRNQKKYKRYALDQLGEFLLAYPHQLSKWTDVSADLITIARYDPDQQPSGADKDDSEPFDRALLNLLRASAFKCLCMAASSEESDQVKVMLQVCTETLPLLSVSWNIRAAIIEGLEKFYGKSGPSSAKALHANFRLVADCLIAVMKQDIKYPTLREQAVLLLKRIIGAGKIGLNDSQWLKTQLKECLDKERAQSIIVILQELQQ